MTTRRDRSSAAKTPTTKLRPPTAHDVARLAGVSQSAVSRAYTPGASISPETRKRVARAAAELGYRPNLFARSLIKRESTLIGVVIPDLGNPFYASLLEHLSAELRRLGYRVLLFSTQMTDEVDPILEEVLNYQVAALILVSSTLTSSLADECQKIGLPVVQLNRTSARANVSSVVGDNRHGARAIAEFLLAGGHSRFAFMAGLESSSTSKEREEAFLAKLNEAGYGLHARPIAKYSADLARQATRDLLTMASPPDALFCANDHMAIAALSVARSEYGLVPGKDISIVGFDDAPLSGWTEIGLTTYRQPICEMTAQAAALIENLIHGEGGAPEKLIVPGRLIIRSSARQPQAGAILQDGELVWQSIPKTSAI